MTRTVAQMIRTPRGFEIRPEPPEPPLRGEEIFWTIVHSVLLALALWIFWEYSVSLLAADGHISGGWLQKGFLCDVKLHFSPSLNTTAAFGSGRAG